MLTLYAIAVALSLPLYWCVLPAAWRRSTFGLLAIAALALHAPFAVGALAALTLAVHALLAWAPRPQAALAAALTLAVLALHKSGHVRLLGVSYVAFRLIHVAIEHARGRLALTTPFETLLYTLFPPAFLSGPIERLPDFRANCDHRALDLETLTACLIRIFSGLAKKLLLVAPLTTLVEPGFSAQATASESWRALIGYSFVVYLDFSAYCDLALGVARLFGWTLSENFAWPYGAASITEFWQRWHITLSTWLRDYVFLPVTIALGRWPYFRDSAVATGAAAAITTMLACGLWHGDSAAFLLWGLGHGLASAAHQVWRQKVLAHLPAKTRKSLLAHRAYRAVMIGVTFLTVALLWPLFRLDIGAALALWGRLF